MPSRVYRRDLCTSGGGSKGQREVLSGESRDLWHYLFQLSFSFWRDYCNLFRDCNSLCENEGDAFACRRDEFPLAITAANVGQRITFWLF